MATSIDQSEFVKTALRLPPKLHAALHEAAQGAGRSYNAEIIDRLLRTFVEDANKEQRQRGEAALMGLQTMLAFHLRKFFDLMPAKHQVEPMNLAARDMASAIGHGTADDIERSLKVYFEDRDNPKNRKAIAHELHARRELLDQFVDETEKIESKEAKDAELEAILKKLKA